MPFILILSIIFAETFTFAQMPMAVEYKEAFADCYDHAEGAEPKNAPRTYKIVRPENPKKLPFLKAVDPETLPASAKIFQSIVEDVRFTNYKCWDINGNISGFDAQLLVEVLAPTNIKYLEFIPIKWENVNIGGQEQLSFFAALNQGAGHVAMAGMSITKERLQWGEMVGPIYKAGKKLMARKDNPKISSNRKKHMMEIPSKGYQALGGLTVLVQGSSIRGDFFKAMNKKYPGFLQILMKEKDSEISGEISHKKLNVIVVDDFDLVNAVIDSQLTKKIDGFTIDLVMVDTGSTLSLAAEGKLGRSTEIVTGNLSADPDLGSVFGLGDGIAIAKGSSMRPKLEALVKLAIRKGKVDALVHPWFNDENAADSSWATKE